MFESFSDVWTPVAPARLLKPSKPLPLVLAGERIVLFRSGNGGVASLIDRCPHRGVALSLGQVQGGTIECPFHGWRFDAQGVCTKVPLNPISLEKRERYNATALPAREAGGLLWVFTGTDAHGTEPAVPDALTESGWSRWVHMETWNTHWTRAMENMLDAPHVPFLHRRTIGRGLRRLLRDQSRMDIATTPTETGWTVSWQLEGERSDGMLEWRRPNGMVLYLKKGKPGFRQHLFCIPEDARHVRMLLISTRQFLRYNPLGWIGDQFNRLVLREDRAIVESSQPAEVPPAQEEMSVATDGPTLSFRKYYERELKRG